MSGDMVSGTTVRAVPERINLRFPLTLCAGSAAVIFPAYGGTHLVQEVLFYIAEPAMLSILVDASLLGGVTVHVTLVLHRRHGCWSVHV